MIGTAVLGFLRRRKHSLTSINRRGVILMYHRIAEPACDPWQLAVSPAHFAEQMAVVKQYGRPVPLRDMARNLSRLSRGRKEVVVTFDDGYADIFHHAAPVLLRQSIPATFFMVTGAIGRSSEFWWDELERIILAVSPLPEVFDLTIAGIPYRRRITVEKQEAKRHYAQPATALPSADSELSKVQLYFFLWEVLYQLSPRDRFRALEQVLAWSSQTGGARPDYLAMTSEQVVALAQSSLFDFGAHTVCHPALSHLCSQEQEITRSKGELEGLLHRPVASFSYPHGAYSTLAARIVERAGFAVACDSTGRVVWRGENPYSLPRVVALNWHGEEFERRLRTWLS